MLKPNNFSGTDMSREWKRGDCQKLWNGVHQEEENEVDQTYEWEKGINGRRLELQKQLEEEDYIIVKWAQEDVETLYSLLNK